jgi:hypothetical protein
MLQSFYLQHISCKIKTALEIVAGDLKEQWKNGNVLSIKKGNMIKKTSKAHN